MDDDDGFPVPTRSGTSRNTTIFQSHVPEKEGAGVVRRGYNRDDAAALDTYDDGEEDTPLSIAVAGGGGKAVAVD